ncbi:MAG TPA: type II secretion system F family protein [Gammaproteobacteria bacterium]|jgi:type IV pilus assembly protein PilC|nr:type II secretion system F family protein [Gammaproteobacteria bacterium]
MILKNKNTLSQSDTTLFFRQLSTMIKAGIPIVQSLEILLQNQESEKIRIVTKTLIIHIKSGKNLYQAMRLHPLHFNEFSCQLIRIGEQTGSLETMLTAIALHHEKHLAFAQRVKQSLFYPITILAIATIMIGCMFLFVIPKFHELFEETKTTLPTITLSIFAFSHFLTEHIFSILLSLIAFIKMLLFSQKRFFKKAKVHLPIIRNYLQKIHLMQFSNHLSLCLSAGIPINQALSLLIKTSTNTAYANTITILNQKLASGIMLHHAMEKTQYFPALMIHMVRTGEESGMLEEMLGKTALIYENEIHALAERFITLLEPLIILALGALIGILIIAMYLPLFNLGNML